MRHRPLRRLFAESMGFEGVFKIAKDYLQPVIKVTALSIPLMLHLADRQRTAVLVGAVYVVLYSLSSAASRHADALARRAGSPQRGARWLWGLNLLAFAVLAVSFAVAQVALAVAIAAFVALSVIQNFWRPILIGRIADHANPAETATVLSIESQAKSLFVVLFAPALGLAVDLMPAELRFLPVGVLGLVIAAIMIATSRPSAPAHAHE